MTNSIFSKYRERYEQRQQKEYTVEEYLNLCKEDPTAYATAAQRLLNAIGEPEIFDTSKDERLGRIFMNRKI